VDGDVVATRTFSIERDPRLTHIALTELEEQHRLAMQIRDRTSQANEAVVLIRSLRSEIEDRLERNSDAELRSTADALLERVTARRRATARRAVANSDPWPPPGRRLRTSLPWRYRIPIFAQPASDHNRNWIPQR
jgi:hypothetical protein